MRRVTFTAVCVVLLGAAAPPADRPTSPAATVRVAAVPIGEIVELFQTNEVRAAALYTDTECEVSGKVARVVTSRYGSPAEEPGKSVYVVELRVTPLDLSRIAVHFYFDKSEEPHLVDLRTAQDVVIRGKCARQAVWTGEYRTGGKDYTEVRFFDCRLSGVK